MCRSGWDLLGVEAAQTVCISKPLIRTSSNQTMPNYLDDISSTKSYFR